MKGVATLTSHRSSQLFNADDSILLVLLFTFNHREYDSESVLNGFLFFSRSGSRFLENHLNY